MKLILLGAAVTLISVLIIGVSFISSTQHSTARQTYPASPVRQTPGNSIPPAAAKPQTKKSVSQTISPTAKKAVVISENANLRKSANQNSEVVQTVAEGSKVDIIKQQGAWFLVSSAGQVGWIHGNTIRLIDADDTKTGETSAAIND